MSAVSRTNIFVSRLLLNSRTRLPLSLSGSSSSSSSPRAATSAGAAARRIQNARPRVLRSFFTKRLQSSSSGSSSKEAQDAVSKAASSPGLRARLTKLMKENGWVAFGIYTALSILDFGLSFALVSAVGAEAMQKGERWVWTKLGFPPVESQEEASEGSDQPHKKNAESSIWTRAALAYGVHKTALLPVRVGLTAWITPATVRLLRSYGYKVGPGMAKTAASKASEAAAKKVS